MMQNAGEVLKEFIEGSSRLLASRKNLKSTFRLDQTTILPRHNNPLKLAENSADSIMQMLIGEEGEYLGPRDAVREVCRDLLYHQDAFLEGMSSAFEEFADRFDPAELTTSFDRHLDSKPLLGFLNKLKYWQLYCDVYPVITDKDTGRFPQAVAEEFVAAYERRIADYKRLDADGSYEPLAATQPLRIRSHDDARPVHDESAASNDTDIDLDDSFDADAAANQA
jgi:type VI secretion system FHA domain protein